MSDALLARLVSGNPEVVTHAATVAADTGFGYGQTKVIDASVYTPPHYYPAIQTELHNVEVVSANIAIESYHTVLARPLSIVASPFVQTRSLFHQATPYPAVAFGEPRVVFTNEASVFGNEANACLQ